MTEQEYVNVKELATIRNIIVLISDLTPEISEVIPASGLADMRKELRRWETNLHERIKIKSK